MNRPPIRLPFPPTPSGRDGRVIEQAMPLPTPKLPRHPLSFFLALALLPTACFNPLVDLESEDDSSGGDTTDTTPESSTTDAMTTVEPDGDSGDPLPVCGDGVVEGNEVCDDGVNDGGYGGCTADCSAPGPFCGDGLLNGEEPCDDGDDVDGNGCNVDCVVSGSVLWTVTVDGPDHETDVATAVAVDSEDNIVVAGKFTIDGHDSVWVVKYAPDGQEVWSRNYCPTGGDCYAHDVAVTPDDGIIVVGVMDDGISDHQDAWIRRYSPEGDVVWTQTYNGPTSRSDSAQSVVTDENGHIYVLIRQDLVEIGNGIVDFVRKYTADGQELWTDYQLMGIRVDDIAILPSGSLILVGQEGNSDYWTPWMQEMTSDGGAVWEATHDDHAPGGYHAVDANATGDLVLSLSLQGQNDFLLLRMAADGQETWSESPWGFNSSTQDVTIDDAGWITCTGSSGQDSTLWTRKYQPNGTIAWTDTYNGPEALLNIDQGQGIARDHSGNLISVGVIQDLAENGTDAWIRKYAP